ncbi:MAG: hypothetical protein JWQ08_1729 [Deinococcus sp.]|nr:hypothetical protein [Deinococcus sp.]
MGALYRVAAAGSEHFYAGYRSIPENGLPDQPRIHLSVAHGTQDIQWLRGDAANLLLHLMHWAARRNHRVRLDLANEVDERGDQSVYGARLHGGMMTANARGLDPLSALLRVLVQAERNESAA